MFLDSEQLPSLDLEKQQYDLHENDPDNDGYRRFLSQLTTPLKARLPDAACGLDYGCGPGPALVAMMRESGFTCAGFDPIYASDSQLLKQRYDFVTCTEVVEHFHRPAVEFDRLVAMLRPGGWLAIMTRWLTGDTDFSRWHYRQDPTHVCFYSRPTFDWIARHYRLQLQCPGDHVVLLRNISCPARAR